MTGPSASGSENGTPISMNIRAGLRHCRDNGGRSLRIGIAGRKVGHEAAAPAALSAGRRSAAVADIRHRSPRDGAPFLDALDVLVPAPRQVDQQHLIPLHRRREPAGIRNRVRRFECRAGCLLPGQGVETPPSASSSSIHAYFGAMAVVQPGMLRPHGGVVEPGGDRVRRARCCRPYPGARMLRVPCSTPCAAAGKSRRVPARTNAAAARLDADQPHVARSSMNASKMPIALLPPPTQATIVSGSLPMLLEASARALPGR